MTNPLESIQPSLRFVREQRELEKVFIVDNPKGADGLGPVNLGSGRIQIPVRRAAAADTVAETPEPSSEAEVAVAATESDEADERTAD